jgi:hypothetical protein
MITPAEYLHSALQKVGGTGYHIRDGKRIVTPVQVKTQVGFDEWPGALGAWNGKVKFCPFMNKAWSAVRLEKIEGRYRVTHGMMTAKGRLEDYDPLGDNDIPRYTFKYPVPKPDRIAILYFHIFSNRSNTRQPMATPDVPPIVAVSTYPRLALSVENSNQANPNDLLQTGGAYGQQLLTNTSPQGPHWDGQNPVILPASAGPQWDGRHPKIQHGPRWHAENEYTRLEIERLNQLYGQNPVIFPASAGPQWDGGNPEIQHGPGWLAENEYPQHEIERLNQLYVQNPEMQNGPGWPAQNEYPRPEIERLNLLYGQPSDNSPSIQSSRYQ